jgi:Protein of unknown function (DUF3060)
MLLWSGAAAYTALRRGHTILRLRIRNMKKMILIGMPILLAMASSAECKTFSGVGGGASYECQAGESIGVDGMQQKLQLRGACDKLDISGVSNQISIEQVAAIDVSGTSNVVRYGSNASGAKPAINASGVGNTVHPDAALRKIAAPAASAESASSDKPAAMIGSIAACNATRTIEGVSNGQAVECAAGDRLLFSGVSIQANVTGDCAAICISGTSNDITVAGDALSIMIEGTSNSLRAARMDAIKIDGMSNQVSYHRSAYKKGPKTAISGIRNGVSRRK